MEKKFNKFLSALLIIIAVSIIVIIGFYIYTYLQKRIVDNKTDHAIEEFDQKIEDMGGENSSDSNEDENSEGDDDDDDDDYSDESERSSTRVSYNYDGYDVVGKIEIPKTKIKYPIFDVATISSMKVSVGIVYGPGLNEVGNTVIMGHNYRNGTFFSDNDRLTVGDSIYITDAYGWRLRYKVYNTYETDSSDFEYATRETFGDREISLASCTDDTKNRLIIWARAR